MKRIIAWAWCLAGSVGLAVAAVNVNTAGPDELQKLKGIDARTAQAIVDYRAQNGDFNTVEDLGKVLDQATVEKVKPELAVAGDPFVPPAKPEKPAKKAKKGKS